MTMTHRSTAPTYQRLTVEPSCSAPDRRLAKQAKRERAQKLRKLADRAWGAPRVLESGSGVRVKKLEVERELGRKRRLVELSWSRNRLGKH